MFCLTYKAWNTHKRFIRVFNTIIGSSILYNVKKIIEWCRPKEKIEETFFLYDIDTQEIETLYA